jgi:phosphate-selective porin OprO/OprP
VRDTRQLKSLLGAVLLAVSAAAPLPAGAANSAMLDLLKILRDRGSISADEYSILANAARADAEKTEAIKSEVKKEVDEKVAAATKDVPVINLKEKLELGTQDGNFKFRIGGRVHFDSYVYNDDDNTDFADGTQFRRARVELESTFWKVWKARLQYDFGGSGGLTVDGLRDAFIQYNGFDGVSVTVGNQKEPFGLDEMTSSNNQNYMERSMMNGAFVPSRNPGILLSGAIGKQFTLASGVFGVGRGNTGGGGAPGAGLDEAWSITTRGTFVPINESGRVLHFGLAHSYRNAGEMDVDRIRTHEFGIGAGTRMVDTGAILSEERNQIGVEAGLIYGPFSMTGEYTRAWVDVIGAGNVDFDGYYVEANYMLTGESRGYSIDSGTFSNPKPKTPFLKGGVGAWQIGLRYSAANLTDGPFTGGEQENLTFALNWYPTNNLKFMANYVHVLDVDRPGNIFDGAEPGVFAFRAQTYW